MPRTLIPENPSIGEPKLGSTELLWEVMFELLIELFKVMGEICSTFWKLFKEIYEYAKKGSKNKSSIETGVQMPERAAQTKGQLVLMCSILVLAALMSLMIPKVRAFVLGLGQPTVVVEKPRSLYPMGQYTLPRFYDKMKFVMEDDGDKRFISYYWYAPASAGPARKLPLVVVLHGKDGLCHAAIHLRKAAMQKNFPAFLLIPQSPLGKVWDAPERYSGEEFPQAEKAELPGAEARSLRDVIFLLAKITQQVPIDQNRMYIVGCDEGAAGVYGAAAHYPGVFAAGLAVAGQWSFLDGPKIAKTPLMILHGVNDKTISPQTARNMVRVLKAAGGKVAYHEFRGMGHECDSPNFYLPVIWKWLFSQRRQTPARAPVPATAATTR